MAIGRSRHSTHRVGEVADHDRDVAAARFRAELGDHGLGRIDAVHLDAPGDQGSAIRPLPIGELEHRAASGEPGQELHGVLGSVGGWNNSS